MKKIKARQKKVNGQVVRIEQLVEHGGNKYIIGVGEEFGGDVNAPQAHIADAITRIQSVTPPANVTVTEEEIPVI